MCYSFICIMDTYKLKTDEKQLRFLRVSSIKYIVIRYFSPDPIVLRAHYKIIYYLKNEYKYFSNLS